MHWSLNYKIEVWYENSYTLKDSIYRNMVYINNINTVHPILISQLQHEIKL